MSLLLPSVIQLAQKGQRFAARIVRFLTIFVVKNWIFFLHKTLGSFTSKKDVTWERTRTTAEDSPPAPFISVCHTWPEEPKSEKEDDFVVIEDKL